EKCYAVTEDCARIASEYFGVQSGKICLMYLGTDTEYFYPARSDRDRRERQATRRELGVTDGETLCIYTGKLIPEKSVLSLAEAVEKLRSQGAPFRALFIGSGPLEDALRQYPGSQVLPSMPFFALGRFYRASDLAIWPGTESISMLDAAACGLPVIISDRVIYRAPVAGNGRVFRHEDVADLATVLAEAADPQERERLGASGAERMLEKFSWQHLAGIRLSDYDTASGASRANRSRAGISLPLRPSNLRDGEN